MSIMYYEPFLSLKKIISPFWPTQFMHSPHSMFQPLTSKPNLNFLYHLGKG